MAGKVTDRRATWVEVERSLSVSPELSVALCQMGFNFSGRGLAAQLFDTGAWLWEPNSTRQGEKNILWEFN
jgi:hypothetical protein